MEIEGKGLLINIADHLSKQNLKLMIIRDSMACQEDHEGWFWIIDDMMKEAEEIGESVMHFVHRTPTEGGSHV